MLIKGLDDPQGLLIRGKRSLLHAERKKRLDALYQAFRKYSDLAQQDISLKDVQQEMNTAMDDVESINELMRELN
jgi:hypothetical protein